MLTPLYYTAIHCIQKLTNYRVSYFFLPPREFYLITENSAGDLQLAVQL